MPSEASRRSFFAALGLLDRRDGDVGRVDPLGQVPQPLPPDAPGDRDLAAHHQELQHLGDVAVVRPPGRCPRHDARVRDVARAQRPGAPEQVEDVAPETVVVAQPGALLVVARPLGRAGEVQAQVAHRPHERVELEQRPVLLQRLLELGGLVRRAEAAPGHEVGTGRDRGGRVDLQQGQLPHDLEQLGRPGGVEHLRAHRDAPRLRLGQPVHGQEATTGSRRCRPASRCDSCPPGRRRR